MIDALIKTFEALDKKLTDINTRIDKLEKHKHQQDPKTWGETSTPIVEASNRSTEPECKHTWASTLVYYTGKDKNRTWCTKCGIVSGDGYDNPYAGLTIDEGLKKMQEQLEKEDKPECDNKPPLKSATAIETCLMTWEKEHDKLLAVIKECYSILDLNLKDRVLIDKVYNVKRKLKPFVGEK